uniref:Uncharacterized protein n=1 Tax=Timema poppense TaxID=170557 RepID=A0A7R9H3M4_TIMPO|nr:unnamed protein product [Timema poppensis]
MCKVHKFWGAPKKVSSHLSGNAHRYRAPRRDSNIMLTIDTRKGDAPVPLTGGAAPPIAGQHFNVQIQHVDIGNETELEEVSKVGHPSSMSVTSLRYPRQILWRFTTPS